ncbi:MAG TPA: hypothetical protein PKD88_01745 [Nitrosomonas sp.]|nr:hypothetical protein [Nitrosomonas sp.]HMW19713.1 hypothetical protein [Nitrosomonas sp.]HMW68018.1 hypothetical protein [Nitrosomonas sp.]HMY60401.1 hypothetical protein [Nitrosomonas sp.]HMY89435.1 hypothetical protein [Nitrosomonas sp.]
MALMNQQTAMPTISSALTQGKDSQVGRVATQTKIGCTQREKASLASAEANPAEASFTRMAKVGSIYCGDSMT